MLEKKVKSIVFNDYFRAQTQVDRYMGAIGDFKACEQVIKRKALEKLIWQNWRHGMGKIGEMIAVGVVIGKGADVGQCEGEMSDSGENAKV